MAKEQKEPMSSVTIEEFIRTLRPGFETIFDLVKSSDGSTAGITVGHRELQPEPVAEPELSRSPKRNHEFHEIQSFLEYITKTATANSVVLADAHRLTATYVINEGSLNGRETCTFIPTLNPLLETWLEGPWRATDFAQFVIENRRMITEDARDIAFLFRQLRMAKNIIIEKGKGKNAINGVMVEVKIGPSGSGDTQQTPLELPDTIQISTPVFLGQSTPIPLEFDLFVYSDKDDQVMVSATNANIKLEIYEQFVESINGLKQDCPENVLVTFGQYLTEPWETVR